MTSTAETIRSRLENPIQVEPPILIDLPNGDKLAMATRKASHNLEEQTLKEIVRSALLKAINAVRNVGSTPIVVTAYWGVGESSWFDNPQRVDELVHAWSQVCNDEHVAWGAGETQILKGIVKPGEILISATCIGIKQT